MNMTTAFFLYVVEKAQSFTGCVSGTVGGKGDVHELIMWVCDRVKLNR